MNNDNNPIINVSSLSDKQMESSLIQLACQSVALQDAQRSLVIEMMRRQSNKTKDAEIGTYDVYNNPKTTQSILP